MSAQVGTLHRTGFPRMMWPALAIVVVLAAGIATVAVVTDDRTNSQTSAGSAPLSAETDRLTALAESFGASTRSMTTDAARWTAIAESFGAPTRSMTTDAARWTAIAESFGSSGIVLGITTPSELLGSLDGSTTGAPAHSSGPIGFHPLP